MHCIGPCPVLGCGEGSRSGGRRFADPNSYELSGGRSQLWSGPPGYLYLLSSLFPRNPVHSALPVTEEAKLGLYLPLKRRIRVHPSAYFSR